MFSSAPYEARPTQVRDDDDRIALGSVPDVFDAEPLLAQLRQSGLPSIRRQLPALEGRIAVVAVSADIAIEPRSGPSALWVVSGRGRPVDQALAANHLAVVSAHTRLRIAARPGAPLLLIDYQPDRLDVTSILRKEKKLYSQWNEELVIRGFFRDRRDGRFLDVGCADYKRLSTRYYLEERLGWSGLAVDALAEYAAGYREHRPRTRFFNYLVGDVSSGPRKFYRVPRFVELSSASRPVAGYLERMVPGGGSETDELNVPTITLNDLLRQQGVDRIAFLSMDIEGHEPEALAGFDIQRWRPRLVCIETQEALADRIYTYFRGRGYARIDRYLPFDPRNWYFAPTTQVPSGAR